MPNHLKDKNIYLSGPIENSNESTNWRIDPKNYITDNFGCNIFDPFEDSKQQWVKVLMQMKQDQDFDGMARICKGFVRKDLSLVDRCDFLVAYIPYKVSTTGTVNEVLVSEGEKKPTLLVCPQGKEMIPMWYFGIIPHKYMFGSWTHLYRYLSEVDAGKHMDDPMWSFVYGKI